MGRYENDYCNDCGGIIPDSSITVEKGSQRRITKPKHFYRVLRGGRMITLCPACWTTTKLPPLRRIVNG